MSKRGIKRKAYLEIASDGSEDLFAQNNNAKRNKTKSKSKRLSRLEEYDEDEGREGSRNFQRWAEIFENNTKGEVVKSKTFMKNFRAKVKKQTDQVRDYMQEQEAQLTQSKDQFAGAFEDLYSDAALSPETSGKAGDKARNRKEDHVLFKDAHDVISGSHSLLKQFKEAEERLKDYKVDLPSAKWKQDKQDIKDLLACGREEGERLVEKQLAPSAYPSPQPDRYKATEKDNLVSELFKESRKVADGETWGAVAADQIKKFTSIAKSVAPTVAPKDEYRFEERMHLCI